MSENTETTRTPENGEIKRAVTPETARVLAGTVDKKFLKPDSAVPPEDADLFKNWLANKKESDVNYKPLERLADASREDFYSDENKQKREEEERKAAEEAGKEFEEKSDMDRWHDAVKENIQFYANEDQPNRDEYIDTLNSIGFEIDKDNVENELSDKIAAFYDEYFDGKSDIKQFVGDIAKDCRDDGQINVDKLTSRLHAVKGLLTSFGQNEDGIPQLIEAHAKAQALLSQDEEKKKIAADATYEHMKNPVTNEDTKKLLEKIAPQSEPEPTTEPKPEQKSDVQKKYEELISGESLLSKDELDQIREKLYSPGFLSPDEITNLKEKRDKSRFKTENLDEMKEFSNLLYKDDAASAENFIKHLEDSSAEDRAAGKPIVYVLELSKDKDGQISARGLLQGKDVPQPATTDTSAKKEDSVQEAKPAERAVEDVELPKTDDTDKAETETEAKADGETDTDETKKEDAKPESEPATPEPPAPVPDAPPAGQDVTPEGKKTEEKNDDTSMKIEEGQTLIDQKTHAELKITNVDEEGKVTLETPDGEPVTFSKNDIDRYLNNNEFKVKSNNVEEGQTATHEDETVTVKEVNGDEATVQITGGPNDGEEKSVPVNDLSADKESEKTPNDMSEESQMMNRRVKYLEDERFKGTVTNVDGSKLTITFDDKNIPPATIDFVKQSDWINFIDPNEEPGNEIG